MQDDFVSMLAHELHTPLTSIRAFTEILLGEPEMELEQRNKLLGIIVSETDRLTQLISQAIDVAKLESGRTEWNATRVDVKEVICDSVGAMNPVFEERQIEVEVRAPEQVSVIAADVDRIIQVMMNLLSNAAGFCEPGAGRIVVELSERAENLRVDVRDNGPAIDAADQAEIFDRFCRVGDRSTDPSHRSELGLYISRKIVEHLGGRLWVENSPGGGACFSFTLPTAGSESAGNVRSA
jgi:signal transduction histidine kinase